MKEESRHLVAYDICNPKRLRRVARHLEKQAVRCQKSVFIYQGTAATLQRLLDQLDKLIDPSVDLIQAWKLAPRQSALGSHRGDPPMLFPDAILLMGDEARWLYEEEDA